MSNKREVRRVLAPACRAFAVTLLGGAALPAFAVSLAATGPAQPALEEQTAPSMQEIWTAGSAALVPLMAADLQAQRPVTVDAPASGGKPPEKGQAKPVDDIQFVKQATESGRKEVKSARDALPQLQNPELKRIAEMLVSDHGNANAKLAGLAEAKGWPVPGPTATEAPPAGTASADFDAKWTAEMIAGHERSVALYSAQAQRGEDRDLRKYAHDTLPTIERHLAQLRSLQK